MFSFSSDLFECFHYFSMHEQLKSQTVNQEKKEKKKKYIHLFPDIKDVKREENYNLAFIEQKKQVLI